MQESVIIDIIGNMIGSTLLIIMSSLVMLCYKHQKSKALLLYASTWYCMAVYFFLQPFVLITGSALLFRMNEAIVTPVGLVCFLLFIDYTRKDLVDWRTVAIGFVIIGAMAGYHFNPATTVEIIVDGSLLTSNIYIWLSNVVFSMLGVSLVSWTIFLYKHVPKQIRPVIKVFVVGGMMFLFATVIAIVNTVINDDIVLMACYILMLVGSSIMSIMIYKHPSIVTVLPHTAYRLIIANKDGELCYKYEWTNHIIDNVLLAGFFSEANRVTKLMLSTVKAGNIREIRLEKATFLMNTSHIPLDFGMLVSKSSAHIAESFEKFVYMFVKTHYHELYDASGNALIQPKLTLSGTDAIIRKIFSTLHSIDESV